MLFVSGAQIGGELIKSDAGYKRYEVPGVSVFSGTGSFLSVLLSRGNPGGGCSFTRGL